MLSSSFSFAAATVALSLFSNSVNAAVASVKPCTFSGDHTNSVANATSTPTSSSTSGPLIYHPATTTSTYGNGGTGIPYPSGGASGGGPYGSTSAGPYGNATTPLTTSTIYSTRTYTSGDHTVTDTIAISTTICPVTATAGPITSDIPLIPELPTTSVKYSTTTNTLVYCSNGAATCESSVTATQTRAVPQYTTICPTIPASTTPTTVAVSIPGGEGSITPDMTAVPTPTSVPAGGAAGTGSSPAPSSSAFGGAAGRIEGGGLLLGAVVGLAGWLL